MQITQATLEMKNAGHTCGMRKCVLKIVTLRFNPLTRDLEAKQQQGITTLVQVSIESRSRKNIQGRDLLKTQNVSYINISQVKIELTIHFFKRSAMHFFQIRFHLQDII